MRLIPRKAEFFDALEAQSEIVVKGAKLLLDCLEKFDSSDAVYLLSKEIHEAEHAGDELVHGIVGRLNKTFITPFDREDIYQLTVRMDDILDYVDSVAKRLVTYKISKPTAQAVELCRIIVRSSEEVAVGVRLLRNLKDREQLLRQCARINQLENEGDQVLHQALTNLFREDGVDAMDVIKWKDLYEHLEVATDKCEDVANILESVVVKYS